MDTFLNFFNQGWVGALIGILGVLIAIYTYKRTKIGPRLVYQMSSLKIIGKNEITPEEITIYFKGIKVLRIIKTTIIIWNSGTNSIDGKNIVKNDPLRLEFGEDEEIIGASILKRTKEVNDFEITNNTEQRNVLILNFEYLDPQDGVSIEILHTDISRYPKFKGSIKGMPNGVINWGRKTDSTEIFTTTLFNTMMPKFTKHFLGIMIILGALITAFSVIVPYYFEELAKKIIESNNNPNSSIFVFLFILGIFYSTLPILAIWVSRRRYPKLLNVEKLESDMHKPKSN
ncbi:hypothetical protein [Brevibacillus porteri]|uniref:hypothetical protein n=1 Tax=Brevibacillus porteri TaxID=2126350 RepID=UPI003D1D1528